MSEHLKRRKKELDRIIINRGNYIHKCSKCDGTSRRNPTPNYEEDESGNIGAIEVKANTRDWR